MFMGEVGLNTRSMLKNLVGRPRSAISKAGLGTRPIIVARRACLATPSKPTTSATNAVTADAPANPPVKKYQPIPSTQTCGATIGSP
jgi:hypothetical protein